MRTGGPVKTAATLTRVADATTPERCELYGRAFDTYVTKLNGMQGRGCDSMLVVARDRTGRAGSSPSHAPIGSDAVQMRRLAGENSDADQDEFRLQFLGLK